MNTIANPVRVKYLSEQERVRESIHGFPLVFD